MQVMVPEGITPGMAIQVQAPDGQVIQVQVPAGCNAGSTFAVALPPPAAFAQAVSPAAVVPTTGPLVATPAPTASLGGGGGANGAKLIEAAKASAQEVTAFFASNPGIGASLSAQDVGAAIEAVSFSMDKSNVAKAIAQGMGRVTSQHAAAAMAASGMDMTKVDVLKNMAPWISDAAANGPLLAGQVGALYQSDVERALASAGSLSG